MKSEFFDFFGGIRGFIIVAVFSALLVFAIVYGFCRGISSGRRVLVKDESILQERYEYLIESGTSPDVAADIVYGKGR